MQRRKKQDLTPSLWPHLLNFIAIEMRQSRSFLLCKIISKHNQGLP